MAGCPALRGEEPDSSDLTGLPEAEQTKKRCMAFRFSSKIMLEHPPESKQLQMMMKIMMLMMTMMMMLTMMLTLMLMLYCCSC